MAKNIEYLAISRYSLINEGSNVIMDAYKSLVLQYEGIRDVIANYCSVGHIGNYINGLGNAMTQKDIEAIKYYLSEIDAWYSRNIREIQSNENVFNFDEHERNIQLISQYIVDFWDYEFPSKQ